MNSFKKYLLLALVVVAQSSIAASSTFSCEQIKDQKTRTSCIAARAQNNQDKSQASSNYKPEAPDIQASKMPDPEKDAAKNALKSLRKLDIRVGTGISYRDYPAVLAETKFEVQQFTNSQAAVLLPAVSQSMEKAIESYDDALVLWQYKFSGNALREDISSVREEARFDGFLSAHYYISIDATKQKLIDTLSEKYHGIASDYRKYPNHNYAPLPANYPANGTEINVDKGVKQIFNEASQQVQKTAEMLK